MMTRACLCWQSGLPDSTLPRPLPALSAQTVPQGESLAPMVPGSPGPARLLPRRLSTCTSPRGLRTG